MQSPDHERNYFDSALNPLIGVFLKSDPVALRITCYEDPVNLLLNVYFPTCQRRFHFIHIVPVRRYLLREAMPRNESVRFHQQLCDELLSDLLTLW